MRRFVAIVDEWVNAKVGGRSFQREIDAHRLFLLVRALGAANPTVLHSRAGGGSGLSSEENLRDAESEAREMSCREKEEVGSFLRGASGGLIS